MRRPALALAHLVRQHAVPLVALAVLTALALSFGIPRLQFNSGQDTLLDPSSKIAQDNARYQSQFGGDPMLVLFEAPQDGPGIVRLFTAENREKMARLGDELRQTGDYHSVLTPLLLIQFAQERLEERMISEPQKLAAKQEQAAAEARVEAAARGASPEEQEAAAQAARQELADEFQKEFGADAERFLSVGDHTLDNPKFVEFILFDADGNIRPDLAGAFPDGHHALMVVRLGGNLSIDETSRAAQHVKDVAATYQFDGVDTLVSGPPLLVKAINDGMKRALVVMAIFAVAIMLAVLFVIFRARWRLLSLPAVLVGCVAAFGLMGFLGIPLTMVTITGLPILIGLGVDFAIQLHSRIEDETEALGSAEAGLDRAFVRLGPALALAAVAAAIGFLVLHLSHVPMIRDFASMLAVGSIMVFIISTSLVSGVLYLRERQRIGEARPAPPTARIEVERLVGGLTGRAVGRIVPIALVAFAIASIGLYVSGRIPTQTDPEKFVPSDAGVLRDLHNIGDVAGSTSEVDLLVETADGVKVTDPAVLDWMARFTEQEMTAHPELHTSNNLATFTQLVTGDPPTPDSAEHSLEIAPPAIRDSIVNGDRSMAAITFAIGEGASLADRRAITDDIEQNADPPPGVSVAPAGIAAVGTASVDAISSNRDLMSFVAIAALLVLLFAVFRNPLKAVAPLLPVLLALGASALMLYFGGIEYSPLTSISGPLIIAMGTEFNILLMSRYFEERANGLDPRQAMATASRRIGRAITASGLTVMGGFAVLAFSNFPLLDNFGKVTALNIGLSLLSTLILLPPLLVWADEEGRLPSIEPQPAPSE